MPVAPELLRLRSELGGYTRRGNTEQAGRVRRELAVAKATKTIRDAVTETPPQDDATLASYVRAIVDAAPAPSPELAEQLAALLSHREAA